MKRSRQAAPKTATAVRQSVTIPARLAAEVARVAKKRHLTMSRGLVQLAKRGVEAEAADRQKLGAAYDRFMSETDPVSQDEAGVDLIRVIFGENAIAEDSVH